ncbi:MAG: chemotaxis protein CheW [Deltaproteobacteria bacterium]|nr:chemotaxis protein CheW [Deltaproteobacteria bacterium]
MADVFQGEFYDEDDFDEDILRDKYLTFLLGDEVYAIDIKFVSEIIRLQKVIHVPDMPPYIPGVVDIRGRVIPVMDVRMRVNMEVREYDERTCVIVIQVEQQTALGLIVDRVMEVAMIPTESIETRPLINMKGRDLFIVGMGKIEGEVRIILDVNKLLRGQELQSIHKVLENLS